MIKSLISFSVRHPVSLVSVLLALCLWGVFSCCTLEADFVPELSQREILVSAKYEGLDPFDMERLVTEPLEEGLAPLKGLKSVASVTRSGLSLIMLELHWGTDVDLALVECRELVDLCYGQLPSRCEKPQVSLPSNLGAAMLVAIVPKDGNLRYGRYLVETDIKGRFQRLEACGGVKITGGEKEEVQVLVDYDAMEAKGVSLGYISEKIAASNFQYPAGTIREGNRELLVKTEGLYKNLQEMEAMPLLYEDFGLVRLGDVAQVEMGSQEKESFFLYDGKPALCLSIAKAKDASPVALSRQVQDEIRQLSQQYGDFYDFVVIKDLSQEVTSSLVSLGISCGVGVVVAAAVILYFLRCWKVSILLSSLIPLCALQVMVVLSLAGRTLNLMSLCGMAVGIGMVVDAGAVVLENLNKKLVAFSGSIARPDGYVGDKDELQDLIVAGTAEVALSNTGSALTTGGVFLPLFFLDGLLGELFLDLALAVMAAILASWLLSLSYIPALYQFIAKKSCMLPKAGALAFRKTPELVARWEKSYQGLLEKVLKRRRLVVIPVAGSLVLAAVSLVCLDYQLLPEIHQELLQVQVTFPAGSTLDSMEEVVLQMNEILEETGMQQVAIFGGLEDSGYKKLAQIQQNQQVVQLLFRPPKSMKLKVQELKTLLSGRNLKVAVLENQDILSQVLNLREKSYLVTLHNSRGNRDTLASKIEVFRDFNLVPPLLQENFGDNQGEGFGKQLVFQPDRLAASRFSTNGMEVALAANQLVAGVESAPFYQQGRRIPVRVKLSSGHQLSSSELASMNVQLEQLRLPLALLGSFTEQPAQEILYRVNRQPAVILYQDGALGAASKNEIQELAYQQDLKLLDLHQQESQEMVGNGAVLLVVALLLLYFIMGAQFESFLIPLLLLAALPPAFGGALALTWVSGHVFSMNTVIALVVLFGTAVNNSIILYESVLQQGGFSVSSIVQAAVSKLETILVTNLTTIFALIPFALDPTGTNSQASLAVAIVGGLALSMVCVLVIIPVIFAFYGEITGRRRHG